MKIKVEQVLSERARLFLLSLAIAVTLWFYVGAAARLPQDGGSVATIRLSNVPITITGLDAGWRATASPTAVDVEMRWPASAVLAVRPSDVQAIADVSGLEAGRHRVNLRIQVPSGVTSVQANPSAVSITLVAR
ncbi:MAG: CdaR family protein [Armatimonadota bacterium]|nr:CdaR family protein [Armatimonadota bacterium]